MTPATSSETYETRYALPPIEEIQDTAEEILAKQERVRQLCRERNAIILAHHWFDREKSSGYTSDRFQ